MGRSRLAALVGLLLLTPGCFFGWNWESMCDPNVEGAVDCNVLEACPRSSICRFCRCRVFVLEPREVLVEAGTFTMGSTDGEADEQPRHEVTLTRSFALRKYEVTQSEFESLMGYNPSLASACGKDCPVENVSWNEALAYCNALSRSTGLAECFDCQDTGTSVRCRLKPTYSGNGGKDYYRCQGYRLPTEAEWEYAARAGTSGAAYGRLADIAWYEDNSRSHTSAVGDKQSNAWGLYDMLGNVWEWTFDHEGAYASGPEADTEGPPSGSSRIARGCGWSDGARLCRVANRAWNRPTLRLNLLGFRVARTGP